jgi:hypothetical protein
MRPEDADKAAHFGCLLAVLGMLFGLAVAYTIHPFGLFLGIVLGLIGGVIVVAVSIAQR